MVKVEDSGGNVVNLNTGTASATIPSGAGGSIAAGGTSGTFTGGTATFSGLALNGVNGTAYTLTFTGDSFTSVASSNITMSTGAATQLVITTEPSTTAPAAPPSPPSPWSRSRTPAATWSDQHRHGQRDDHRAPAGHRRGGTSGTFPAAWPPSRAWPSTA